MVFFNFFFWKWLSLNISGVFFADHRATVFTLSKTFETAQKKIFFANFCHEIGYENDQTYIFHFVRYLSTFTINIKNTKFVKDLPMIDAQFRFNQGNSFREEDISVFSRYGPVLILWPVVAAILDLYQKLSKLRKKNLFCQFLSWNRVRERSNIYISFC
jgi:hypothetical protein